MENMSIKQETLEFREVTVDMRQEVERYTKSAGLLQLGIHLHKLHGVGCKRKNNNSL